MCFICMCVSVSVCVFTRVCVRLVCIFAWKQKEGERKEMGKGKEEEVKEGGNEVCRYEM